MFVLRLTSNGLFFLPSGSQTISLVWSFFDRIEISNPKLSGENSFQTITDTKTYSQLERKKHSNIGPLSNYFFSFPLRLPGDHYALAALLRAVAALFSPGLACVLGRNAVFLKPALAKPRDMLGLCIRPVKQKRKKRFPDMNAERPLTSSCTLTPRTLQTTGSLRSSNRRLSSPCKNRHFSECGECSRFILAYSTKTLYGQNINAFLRVM